MAKAQTKGVLAQPNSNAFIIIGDPHTAYSRCSVRMAYKGELVFELLSEERSSCKPPATSVWTLEVYILQVALFKLKSSSLFILPGAHKQLRNLPATILFFELDSATRLRRR